MTTFEHAPIALPHPPAVVELSGIIASDLVEYVQHKVALVLAHTGRPAIHSHVRVVRHPDPARARPVTAHATVRLAGVSIHVHADGTTAREAADLLIDRLDRRIARTSRTHRGDRCAPPPPVQPSAEPAVGMADSAAAEAPTTS